jgi:hypothetical protein
MMMARDALARLAGRLPLILAVGLAALLAVPGYEFIMGLIGGPTLRDVRVERTEVLWEQPAETKFFGERAEMPWLKVHLTTERDLSIYGRVYRSTVNLLARRCGDVPLGPQRMIGTSGPWTEGGASIGYALADEPELRHDPNAEGRYPYVIYLSVRTRGTTERVDHSPRDMRWVEHDLRRDADDICFHIQGAPLRWGTPHRSGPFTIPYPLIAATLARAGLPHAAVP